ncbi:MAG: hypothetical protein WCH34_09570 [Bacteroidota bacterium]
MKKNNLIKLSGITLVALVLMLASCGESKKTDSQNAQLNNNDSAKVTTAAQQTSTTANAEFQKYVGTYKSAAEGNCSIEITVTAQNDGCHYNIKTKKKTQEGLIKITKSNDEVYFDFVGYKSSDKKQDVSAQFSNNSIVIENYGNAQNQYTNFSECDAKYIELPKVK